MDNLPYFLDKHEKRITVWYDILIREYKKMSVYANSRIKTLRGLNFFKFS
jgi:hypothetical protein